jgi:hypothetical protein
VNGDGEEKKVAGEMISSWAAGDLSLSFFIGRIVPSLSPGEGSCVFGVWLPLTSGFRFIWDLMKGIEPAIFVGYAINTVQCSRQTRIFDCDFSGAWVARTVLQGAMHNYLGNIS